MQKAIVLNSYVAETKLNELLADGWKFVSATPMGVGGRSDATFAAIVIIENKDS